MSTHAELYQDAMQEAWYEQLYEEHAEQAREEFRADRLTSYYSVHKELAESAYAVLADARALRDISAPAALIRATTASELGVKNLLLRPIVYGLVHSESLAGAISELAMAHHAVDRYRDLLIGILREYGGIDLENYARPSATQPLWGELKQNQDTRNRAVHRGEVPTADQRDAAIGVAEAVLEVLFPQVISNLGFHMHGPCLCKDSHVSERIAELRAGTAR